MSSSDSNRFPIPYHVAEPNVVSGLTERVILFSRFLRNHGFKIFSSSIMDALKSLGEIDSLGKEDFFCALRANLTSYDWEWKAFRALFETFWKEGADTKGEEGPNGREKEQVKDGERVTGFSQKGVPYSGPSDHPQDKEAMEGIAYCPVSYLVKKNLAQVEKREIQIAQIISREMISPFRIALTRRFRRSKRAADMDFPRILKKSLRTEGISFELFFKKRRKRLKRLVILADVSGSMDRYVRFVMPFIMGVKGVGSKADLFVFSPHLTLITPLVKHFPIEEALERIFSEVPDWSGGTRIGYSLHQFNQEYGPKLREKRAVVVIMSDGWDLGGKDLLRREMATLSKGAYCLIWLNPMAADQDYRPICQGMQTALPYVDYFLPADSLQSLKRIGRTLTKVMVQ